MSNHELTEKIRELKSLQQLIEEAQIEADKIKTVLKTYMGDCEELRAGEYKITYKSVTSSKLDTAAFKKAMPELAAVFTKETTVRRFCVA